MRFVLYQRHFNAAASQPFTFSAALLSLLRCCFLSAGRVTEERRRKKKRGAHPTSMLASMPAAAAAALQQGRMQAEAAGAAATKGRQDRGQLCRMVTKVACWKGSGASMAAARCRQSMRAMKGRERRGGRRRGARRRGRREGHTRDCPFFLSVSLSLSFFLTCQSLSVLKWQ